LLECNENEFKVKTLQNHRLASEISRRRYQMDPKIDFIDREEPEIIKRRFEIEANSIKKSEIELLVKEDATEQELSRLLKKDLSLFGEVYGHPDEEYICFSEFPILDGYVDFAVFTGRSRMDMYLIEVKGANFNLVNRGHYEKFSSKVEEAAGQIRDRLKVIFDNYEKHRIEFHRIREKVEAGIPMYNSLIGPFGDLLVDPNKAVDIYPVIIAGRTKNDLEESHKRYSFETHTKPTIKLESWDSWLKKLRRS
jgi:hypothetical protein